MWRKQALYLGRAGGIENFVRGDALVLRAIGAAKSLGENGCVYLVQLTAQHQRHEDGTRANLLMRMALRNQWGMTPCSYRDGAVGFKRRRDRAFLHLGERHSEISRS